MEYSRDLVTEQSEAEEPIGHIIVPRYAKISVPLGAGLSNSVPHCLQRLSFTVRRPSQPGHRLDAGRCMSPTKTSNINGPKSAAANSDANAGHNVMRYTRATTAIVEAARSAAILAPSSIHITVRWSCGPAKKWCNSYIVHTGDLKL